MLVRKLVGCVWMALLLLLYFVDVSSRRQMAGCQFSPEVSLREKSGLVIFKFNLLNCLVMLQICLFEVKFSFNSPEQEESSTKGRHKMGYAPRKALCFRVL